MEKLVLHEDPISGNCYKIKLTAALLGLRMECRAYSVLHGETRTPQFLSHGGRLSRRRASGLRPPAGVRR